MKIIKCNQGRLKLIILILIVSELLIWGAEAKGGGAAGRRSGTTVAAAAAAGGYVYAVHAAAPHGDEHNHTSSAGIVSHPWSWFLVCNFSYIAFVRMIA